MIRYTTPTVQLPIKDVDITKADEVYASFGQGTSTLVTKLVKKSKRSMAQTGTLLKIDMAQDETATFSRLSECKVQVNWSIGQKRYATSVAKMPVTENLLGNKLDLVGSTTPVYVLEPILLTTDGVKDGELPKEWARPSEWPNLDTYDYGTDELYMTFDGTQDDSHCAFKIAGTSYTVEINGQTWTQGAGSTFSYGFAKADGDYPVVHVKADGNISRFEWMAYTVDDRSYTALQNPVLERVGDVYDYGDTDAPTWGTYYLVREKVKRHACLHETLAQTWYYCNSLQSLDLSGWDTANWNVTSLTYTWFNCNSLKSLNLSGWNTTNWNVTSFAQTWFNCSSLQSLDLSKFDMSKITALGNESYAPTSTSLQDIIVGFNNYGKYAPTSCVYLNLKSSKALTHESLIEVGKMLAAVTAKHYLQLGTDLSNKLSEAEKAEITAKGWTIA